MSSFGTIIKRPNRTFTAIPDNGTVNGKRNRAGSKTFETKREAKQYLEKLHAERIYGSGVLPNKITVRECLLKWIEGKAAIEKRKQTTIVGYMRVIDKYLIPAFGDKKLQDLKATEIQQYFIEKASTLSGKTLHL
jgi:hypothetical protein